MADMKNARRPSPGRRSGRNFDRQFIRRRFPAIRWRPAPVIGASLGESRFAVFRFQIVPVEGGGGKVEQLQKGIFVGLVLLLHLAQNEDVATEEELVRLGDEAFVATTE